MQAEQALRCTKNITSLSGQVDQFHLRHASRKIEQFLRGHFRVVKFWEIVSGWIVDVVSLSLVRNQLSFLAEPADP
jgi:hypothetical protein